MGLNPPLIPPGPPPPTGHAQSTGTRRSKLHCQSHLICRRRQWPKDSSLRNNKNISLGLSLPRKKQLEKSQLSPVHTRS
ncbi:unnamed protein product [Larinioides sclopetarius]|uniref:Uncharacterized protein n=1 Tax=Larinioides sclopetarius TaxID=280406 RepID=A0AAV2AIU7_9ARAC